MGGYIIGILVGILVHNLAVVFNNYYILDRIVTVIAGGLAVALAMFLMTITDTEHAPATSIAVGLVVNEWDFGTVALILVGIIIISAIQKALKPRMIDLF